jgi:hypothetical protein
MDLCGVLREAGLAQYAGAAAAAADLRELSALALTDPARLRSWLKAELGVTKLGHREKILNALRRADSALALVAVAGGDDADSEPAAATAAAAAASADSQAVAWAVGGGRTGVFIGDDKQFRPLPSLGEAGMHIRGWSLAEASEASSEGAGAAGEYLLCSHVSGTQLAVLHGGGSVWVRRHERQGQGQGGAGGSQRLRRRVSSGARISMASGKKNLL